jgi:hypothetical protein
MDHFFEEQELGDSRLIERAQSILENLSSTPSRSFPRVFSEQSDLQAFYRFLNNPRVAFEDVLEPFIHATAQAELDDNILFLHDTTTIEPVCADAFGPTQGGAKGFFMHLSLAVNRKSKAIAGPAAAVLWERGGKKKSAAITGAINSESRRWLDQVRAVEKTFGTQGPIHVMDREADAYWLLADLSQQKSNFVIRLCHNRAISEAQDFGVFDQLRMQTLRIEREVKLTKRKGTGIPKKDRIHPPRKMRKATLGVSASTVEFRRPQRNPNHYPAALTVNVVRVYEVSTPPEGEPSVEWFLVTTLPIETSQQIEKIVDIYVARWMIEEYFKALKTGCQLESRQLENPHAWKVLLALFIPTAMLLYNLKVAEVVSKFISEAQKILVSLLLKKSAPELSSADILSVLARLGGHIKANGPPGWLVLSRGYETLVDMERALWLIRAQRDM